MEFLEKKRGKFPRLFFLSNEELIEIFGKGNMLVQSMREDESKSFIGNIFEGVDKVIFGSNEELSHMVSKDGEEVHLFKEVLTRNIAVDKWLLRFEDLMK
jgi:dynein heavy chain